LPDEKQKGPVLCLRGCRSEKARENAIALEIEKRKKERSAEELCWGDGGKRKEKRGRGRTPFYAVSWGERKGRKRGEKRMALSLRGGKRRKDEVLKTSKKGEEGRKKHQLAGSAQIRLGRETRY